MDMIIIALQVSLAIILAVAAIGKLLDLPGSRQAMHDFGVPERFADPLGTALPVIELLLAILLLPGATSRWAALAAMLLFLAFIAGIGINLTRGRQPDCHCFGQFHSSPAGWPTIARNVGFVFMSAIIVWQGSRGPVDWFSSLAELSQIVVVLGVTGLTLLAAQVWLSSRTMLQQRELLELLTTDDSALPVLEGEIAAAASFSPRSAPAFDLPTLNGGRLTLKKALAPGKPVLLVFVDPKCGPCRKLVPEIKEWSRRFSADFSVVLISRGGLEDNRQKFGDLTVLLQTEREIVDLYNVEGTPTGVLVSASGMIWDAYAAGGDGVRDLVVRITRGETGPKARRKSPAIPRESNPQDLVRMPAGPAVGAEGTRLPLPDLDGRFVGLDDLRGERSLLLFISPDCSYSRDMLEDLREWEEAAGERAGRLLVISDGSVEANRALGLSSRIVLDESFTTGHHYGVSGTPSAIVLDGQGRVASELATGADAVLDVLDAEIAFLARDVAATNA